MTDETMVRLRRTPYELVFGPEHFEALIFPAIAEEAGPGGVEGGPEAFVMLGRVGNLLRSLRPEDTGPGAVPPGAIRQYGALTWHAWRFWKAGRPVYALSEGVARALLGELPPIGEWRFRPPAPAGYLQLPRHRLWTRIDADAVAEPVDGLHWTWLEPDPEAGRAEPRIDILLALGMRAGRGGLSVIEASAAPPRTGHWGDMDARADGSDFGNVLPGGELQEYNGIVSFAEVLKLVSRIFHHIESVPASVSGVTTAEPADTGDGDVPSSRLPYRVVWQGGEQPS